MNNGINTKLVSENYIEPLIGNCLFDLLGKRFSCIHKGNCHNQSNCFKNSPLTENIDFRKFHFHQADRLLWCEETFPDILKFIESESVVKITDYRFVFNHRYIGEDGKFFQFMHEGTISFTDDILLPVLSLKVFFEIADDQMDKTIVLTIFKYSIKEGYQKIFNKVYGLNNNSLLTERELEVIRYCHEGLSSKMIAEKMGLSYHTVKNHKRNCMEKTMTHSITELIHNCIENNCL